MQESVAAVALPLTAQQRELIESALPAAPRGHG
jgi:hypothetical protein